MKRIVTGFVLAALFALPAGGQDSEDTDSGSFLERTLENALSGDGRDVEIRGFRGALSSTATLEEMTFSDPDGVWLTLRDVELNWSRAQLLRGRVQVTHLRAAEILLPRPPLPDDSLPAAEAGGFALPELPVSISVGEVSAARVVLGEAVFGLETELSLQGALELAEGAGQGRIEADRIDGPFGQFVIGGGFNNSDRVLSVTLDVEEEPGGIVATLTGLPGAPSVAIDLQGEGPLTDFSATLALATEGQDRLQGQFALQGAEDAPSVFRADVSGDVTPLFQPEFRDFFGPDVALAVAGSRAPDGVLTLDELELAAQQLTLSGEIVVGADGLPRFLDLTGEIASADGSPVLLPGTGEATRVGRADLAVAFDADEGERWTADIAVSGLQQGDLSADAVTVAGGGTIITEGTRAVTADIDIGAEALNLGNEATQSALGDALTADLILDWEEGGPLNLPMLQIAGATYGLEGGAVARFGDGGVNVSGEFEIEAADLSVFSALAGRPMEGGLTASLSGEVAPVAGLVDVTLTGQGDGLSVGIAEVDNLIAGVTNLDAAFRRDVTGTYLDRFSTRSDTAEITGSGRLETGGGEGVAQARLQDAGLVLEGLTGPLTVEARVGGTGNIWDVSAQVAGEGLSASADLVIDGSREVPYASGSASLEAAEIAPFGALAGRELGGAVRVSAQGGGAQDLSAFDINLTGGTDELRTGIAQADALLGGAATVALTAVGVDGLVTLRRFEVEAPDIQLAGEGTVGLDRRADLDLSGRLPRPELVAPGLPGPLELTAVTRGGPEAWDVTARLESPEARAAIDAAIDISGEAPRIEGNASAAVSDLSPFSELAGRDLGGAVNFEAGGVAVADLSELDITLSGTLDDLRAGIPRIDQLLAGRTDIDVAVLREGESISAPRLSVENAALRMNGGGILSLEQEGEARVDLTLLQPGILVPGLAEPIQLIAEASGGPDVWDILANLEGEFVTGRADVSADLSGDVPQVGGDIALRSDDLSLLAELVGRPVGGAVDLNASGALTADFSELDLTLDGSTTNLRTGIAQADAALAGRTDIDIAVQRSGGSLSAPRLSVRNAALTLSGGGTLSRDQAGSAEIDLTLLDPGIFVSGVTDPVTLAARAEGGPDLWDIRADLGGGPLTGSANIAADLSGEVPVVQGDATLGARNISPFAQLAGRQLGGAFLVSLTGSASTDLSAFDAGIEGSTQDLRLGQPDLDRLLQGEIALALNAAREDGVLSLKQLSLEGPQIRISGSGSMGDAQNVADLDLRLANLGIFVPELPGPLTTTLSARQADGSDWTVDLDAEGPGGITTSVDGAVAPDFETVDLRATGLAPLGLAGRFIAPRAIEGTAQFDFAVQGAPGPSAVTGQITTSGARFVDPVLGIGLDGLGASVGLNGGTASIEASGNLSDGGQVAVGGTVGLAGALNSDLTVRLTSAAFVDPGVVETSIDGQIQLAGPLTGGANITGGLTLNPTEILISPSAFSSSGSLPDLVHVGEPADVRLTRQRAGLIRREGSGSGPGASFGLDITVDAPNQIFVRGMGLDAELGGSIRIRGTTDAPLPTGQFDLVRGRMDVLGRRLTMEEGSATLQGDFDAAVRLVATSTVEDTEINITIEGPVSAPDIVFSSNPDLPQDEVISRLLFGRGIDTLSPLQAARLAGAVANLASGGGGGLFGSVRRSLGLDDLALSPGGGGGGVGARAGAYVAENAYTDVEITDEGETEVTINLNVSPSVRVRAGVGSTGESSLGVFFERDY